MRHLNPKGTSPVDPDGWVKWAVPAIEKGPSLLWNSRTMMGSRKTLVSTLKHYGRIPAKALLIDTVIAVVLFGLAIYHFTQPDQAWRSGCTELFCVALLLAAAYRVSPVKSAFIHLFATVFTISLGIYHLTHGGGWRSGLAELLFAVLLIVNALIILRAKTR